MNSYSEKLKDPRWQKKRLEIFQRDSWTCQRCKSEVKTLHVHHKAYTFGLDPWEYPDSNLITLCHDCHDVEEMFKVQVQETIYDLQQMGLDYEQIYRHLLKLVP